jgi:hypothetical protein
MPDITRFDDRKPLKSDEQKPWGAYYVLKDWEITEEDPLPGSIQQEIKQGMERLLLKQPELKQDRLIQAMLASDYSLVNIATADEKILLVDEKQPGQNVLSMQYHGRPDLSGHLEVWEFLTAGFVVSGSESWRPFGWPREEYAQELNNLKIRHIRAGERLVILPGQWHALAKQESLEPLYVREFRISLEKGGTNEDRENNIVRVLDNSRRDGCAPFPAELIRELNNYIVG